jgi:hypothetical protein
MFKENSNTTDAIIELIKTLPEKEQIKISDSLADGKKAPKSIMELSNKEYAKRLKSMNDFVKKNRFTLPKDFKFDREEAHERK